MANRFPLIVDDADGNKIKELPTGDNLNLQGNNIVNLGALSVGGNITATGTIDAAAVTVGGAPISTGGGGGLADLVSDTTPQLGGNLDVNGKSIVSLSNTSIKLLPDGIGTVIIDGDGTTSGLLLSDGLISMQAGGGTPAKIEMYCEVNNSHKVTLAAPAHAEYSGDVLFTLPPTTGLADQILKTDGYGKTSWVNQNTGSLSASDISVQTLTASGNGSLTYDSSQAKFSFAPADTANFVSSGDNVTVLNNNAGFVTIQSVFNSFVQGANMTITQDGSGNITFAASGSGTTPTLDEVLAVGKVSTNNISVGGVTATDATYNNQFKNTEVDGTLKVSTLSGNSVVIAGGDGLLSTDTDITYNPSTNTLNVSGPLTTQTLTASGVVSGGGLTSTGAGTPNFNFSADVQFNAGSGSRFKFRTGFVNLDQVASEPSGADSEIGDIIYHSAYSTLGVYVADTDGSSTPGWIYIPSVALKKPPTLPNMSTAERNAITAVPGMIIFNTNSGKAQVYDSSSWQDLF